MKEPFRFLFRPMRTPGFPKLFLVILFLLIGTVSIFIRPGNLDQSDFMLIAWDPGQQLLTTGSVDANYPYPLWTVVAMLPLAVWPPKTAMLLMFTCNMLMFAASLAIIILIFEWELSPILLALGASLSSFFLPILGSLWLGQLTIFSLFILVLTIYFYLKEQWGWLGIALGLSFIKPQIMLLLTGFLLLWALLRRKRDVLFGFGAVMSILILISLPAISTPMQIIGGGIGGHLGSYILVTSTIWGVTMSLGYPLYVPLIISLVLIFWLGWAWLPFLQGEKMSNKHDLFLFSAAIMVNLIVIPYSWMHNIAMILLPLGYMYSIISTRNKWEQAGWLSFIFLVTHPLMYLLYLLIGLSQNTQAYQIIPVLILLPVMAFLEYKTTNKEKIN